MFHVKKFLSCKSPMEWPIYNMVAVSHRELVKKLRWGKLAQISQGKFSAPKYCEFSDENSE